MRGSGQEAEGEQHLIPNMLHVDTNDPLETFTPSVIAGSMLTN